MTTEKLTIMTPQFDRAEELDFPEKPSDDTEFYGIISNAQYDTLFGTGFRTWASFNDVVKENQSMKERRKVTLPAIDLTGQGRDTFDIEVGREPSYPLELLAEDKNIVLFPAEWYDVIPNGFMVTGLHGNQYAFEKGVTDNDRRFGCLGYGILH